jgi:hypothetical protein
MVGKNLRYMPLLLAFYFSLFAVRSRSCKCVWNQGNWVAILAGEPRHDFHEVGKQSVEFSETWAQDRVSWLIQTLNRRCLIKYRGESLQIPCMKPRNLFHGSTQKFPKDEGET